MFGSRRQPQAEPVFVQSQHNENLGRAEAVSKEQARHIAAVLGHVVPSAACTGEFCTGLRSASLIRHGPSKAAVTLSGGITFAPPWASEALYGALRRYPIATRLPPGGCRSATGSRLGSSWAFAWALHGGAKENPMPDETIPEPVELSQVVDPEAFIWKSLRVYLDPLGEGLWEPDSE